MSEPKRINDLSELLEPVQTQARKLLELCKANKLDAKIIETYRTQERQDYLYEQGRTRPGNIVTWTRNSNHTGRKAFDLIQNKKGVEYDKVFLEKVAELARPLGLDWGGDWKTQDCPHFENQTLRPIPVKTQEVSSWAKEPWEWSKANKLMDGTRPQDNVTREELATVLYRLSKL